MKSPVTLCLVAGCLILASCGGQTYGEDPTSGGGAPDQLYCVGNPDTAVICGPRTDAWVCEGLPNAAKKCVQTPDGQGGWSCIAQNGTVVCVKDSPGVTGGAGWNCSTDDAGKTTCTAVGVPGSGTSGSGTSGSGTTGSGTSGSGTTGSVPGGLAPPGGGTWNCTVEEFGVVCVGEGGDTGSSPPGTGETSPGTGTGSGTGSGIPTEGSGPTTTQNGFSCSYAMIVFTYGGQTYVVKIDKGATTCIATGFTSKDATFNFTCNGSAYDSATFVVQRDGTPVLPYHGASPCSALFTASGHQVQAAAGVTIIFAAVHDGSFADHFEEICPPPGGTTSFTASSTCS